MCARFIRVDVQWELVAFAPRYHSNTIQQHCRELVGGLPCFQCFYSYNPWSKKGEGKRKILGERLVGKWGHALALFASARISGNCKEKFPSTNYASPVSRQITGTPPTYNRQTTDCRSIVGYSSQLPGPAVWRLRTQKRQKNWRLLRRAAIF